MCYVVVLIEQTGAKVWTKFEDVKVWGCEDLKKNKNTIFQRNFDTFLSGHKGYAYLRAFIVGKPFGIFAWSAMALLPLRDEESQPQRTPI